MKLRPNMIYWADAEGKAWMAPVKDKEIFALLEGDLYKVHPFEPILKDAQYVKMKLFNEHEVHPNVTVEVWRNTETGDESWGWFEEGGPLHICVEEETND